MSNGCDATNVRKCDADCHHRLRHTSKDDRIVSCKWIISFNSFHRQPTSKHISHNELCARQSYVVSHSVWVRLKRSTLKKIPKMSKFTQFTHANVCRQRDGRHTHTQGSETKKVWWFHLVANWWLNGKYIVRNAHCQHILHSPLSHEIIEFLSSI